MFIGKTSQQLVSPLRGEEATQQSNTEMVLSYSAVEVRILSSILMIYFYSTLRHTIGHV